MHFLILDILSKHASMGQSYYCCVVIKSRPTVTPWTVAHQTPLFLGFSRQEYWSRLPFPSLGDLPDPRIEPMSPALQADALPLSHQGSPVLHLMELRIVTQIILCVQWFRGEILIKKGW